jgi:hypothetical protein
MSAHARPPDAAWQAYAAGAIRLFKKHVIPKKLLLGRAERSRPVNADDSIP